jgi:hypothetical protein
MRPLPDEHHDRIEALFEKNPTASSHLDPAERTRLNDVLRICCAFESARACILKVIFSQVPYNPY